MPETLKPCPFCGGEAEYNCFPTDYPTEHCCAYVVCTKCRAEINREGRVGDARRLKEQAIDVWNRRAQQPNELLTVEHMDCKTCQFEDRDPDEEPCRHCKGAYPSRYAHKPEGCEKE